MTQKEEKCPMKTHPGRKTTIQTRCRYFLYLCGPALAVSEIWKQWYLTAVIEHGHYNWWYFPFQLCSIPMYILLVLPRIKNPTVRGSLTTFLMCYGMLGGIAVFADTSGLHYPSAALTIHSYLWHILLILIGIVAGIYYRSSDKAFFRSFIGSTVIYIICCGIASIINAVFSPYGTIDMFYINPRYPMVQIVFCELAEYIGNPLTIFLYMAATILGAFCFFCAWNFFFIKEDTHR